MDEAEIISLGTGGRPGRATGRAPSSAARGLVPGARRSRRAHPPLAAASGGTAPERPPEGEQLEDGQPEDEQPEGQRPAEEEQPAAVLGTDEGQSGAPLHGDGAAEADSEAAGADSERDPTRTRDRHPLGAFSPGEWLTALQGAAQEVFGEQWEPNLARMLAFCRRRVTGDYTVDEYGFDPEVTQRFVHAALRPLARRWFRIEVLGAENLPAAGGALVVSNHSGTVPMDGLMTMVSVHDHTGRFLRPLAADLVFTTPVVSAMARKAGATLACQEDAERMLSGGELVGVWPEGFKGIGKPYADRYKLQRFGRGGFVSAALRARVPIVPLAVVGAEEIYPLVGNVPALARLLGLPYVPITPLFPWLGPLGMVPLPSKWLLEFGEPIRTDEFDEGAADDPMLVFDVTDQVRETIQQTLYSLLMRRESVFR